MSDLPIIQKTYDLIKWYVPILNRLPRNHKFLLGDRITTGMYDLLDGLILARYLKQKLEQLESLNTKLDAHELSLTTKPKNPALLNPESVQTFRRNVSTDSFILLYNPLTSSTQK